MSSLLLRKSSYISLLLLPIIVVILSITATTRLGPHGTVYRGVLLRQSSREGDKVNNRTLANLSHGPPQEVEAIRLALQHQDALAVLRPFPTAPRHAGRSVGAVWVL
jgi:hypothetical protein